jgi:two-component system, NarL family, nitrate/nitrite response regulator NarL
MPKHRVVSHSRLVAALGTKLRFGSFPIRDEVVFVQLGSELPIRVVIADETPSVVAGTAALLGAGKGIYLVAVAQDPRSCLNMVKEHRPDVLILAWNLGEVSTVQLAHRVQAELPTVSIIVMSETTSSTDEVRGKGVGAILPRSTSRAQFLAAVRAAAGRYADADLYQAGWLRGRVEGLTAREYEVLLYLRDGTPNPDIARALGIAPRTVAFHVDNLLRKLGTRSRSGAVVAAEDRGLIRSGLAVHNGHSGTSFRFDDVRSNRSRNRAGKLPIKG